MKTGAHLKIKSMGENVLGVKLEGNPKKPEPDYFRVMFPGGSVDVSRCDNGEHWVHIRVDSPLDGGDPQRGTFGKLVDGRLDCRDESSSVIHERNPDLDNPSLYHAAFRVKTEKLSCSEALERYHEQ